MAQFTDQDLVLTLKANVEDLQAAMKKVEEKLEDVDKNTKKTSSNMTKAFKDAANTIQTIITGKIVMSIKRILDEDSKLISQLNALKATGNFDKIASQFNQLEAATGGLVNKMELLPSINKAFAFGIDLSNDRLTKFTALAQKTALIMGTDLTSAFNDLIVGVARQSKLILDNLGVIVDIEKANRDYAKSLGKTSDALTDNEKKTALLNQVIQKLEENTKGIDVTKLITPWEKMVSRIEVGIKDVRMEFAGFVNDVMDWSEGLGGAIYEFLYSTEEINKELKKMDDLAEIEYRYQNSLKIMSADRKKIIEDSVVQQIRWRKEIEKQYELEQKMAFVSVFQKIIDDAKQVDEILSLEEISKKSLVQFEGFQKGLNTITDTTGKELEKANEKNKKDKEKQDREEQKRLEKLRQLAKEAAELQLGDLKMSDFNTEQEYRDHLQKVAEYTDEIMQHGEEAIKDLKIRYSFDLILKERQKQAEKEAMEESIKNAKLTADTLTKIQEDFMSGVGAKSLLESMLPSREQAAAAAKQEEERAALLEQTWENAYNTISNVAQNTMFQMWDAMIKGEEIKAQQVIGSLLYQAGAGLVSDGIANLWKAAAMAFYNPAAAGPLAGIAAGEIAAGTAMGYAGQKIMPAQSSGSAGATERNAVAEQQPTVINVKVSAFGDSVAEAVNGMTPVLKTAKRQKII